MRRRPIIAALMLTLTAACSDSGTSSTSTSTTTGSTSTSTTTGEVDCAAPNSCLLHPGICPGPCACDDERFFVAKCVVSYETDSSEYLTRCVNGQALVGLCPDGCALGFAPGEAEPAHCKPPPKRCDDVPCCADPMCNELLPDDCGTCETCPGGLDGAGCLGQLWVVSDFSACEATEFCPFGCEPGEGCCIEAPCL